jgi:dienelactone hydrolase
LHEEWVLSIQTRIIDYDHDGVALEGQLAWDAASVSPRPGVLVAHAWAGRSDFEDGKAMRLAELGYAGFAIDLYGKGVRGSTRDENSALMRPFLDDRALLQARLLKSLNVMREQAEVDADRVAAIGYCFGGLCALDLARTGEALAGVASFHGLLGSPGNTAGKEIRAKVLVLHGWDDPMAKPEQVVELARELSTRGADWQIHGYGNTMHAFTNPAANDPGFGTVYSDVADRRSWGALQGFLAELFD